MKHRITITPIAFFAVLSCGPAPKADDGKTIAAASASTPEKVGYDLRRLRPRNEEPLAQMFDRLFTQATAEGKQTAVLFSADWCEPCRKLELELGNTHPAADIGHVRIFELKEEDWEAATRMDEFGALRKRWYEPADSYPVFIVLDGNGNKLEEMKEAIERLQGAGQEPTVAQWFRGLDSSQG
ncbi:MAG: thioredoxin family protein [Deltaproteobacteria bacterium]|nr:thioredoxin family protein [Deltaproteobacteria bacterium]